MEHYQELSLIGKGSYGKVYKVESKADHEVYVVKKVALDGAPKEEAEAAIREGQVLSLLRHPHIVPYKEFFKAEDGDVCLVMAFCEGGDLFQYIRDLRNKSRTVPEPQIWQWLVQLLLSLSYIHSKRILHRDVKTQNIFLSGGKVLLGDFGLAKQLQRTFEMARTPIGTPYYMAPEVFEEQPYSFKSDMWALGCVMYEMMTGKAAFAADNLSRVVLRVIRGQYDPIPETYTEPLRRVVTSMLLRDVKVRPEANQMLTDPAVVPYVQRYLESLTAEGPSGWATWRMKLPMTALVQMSAALEAAQGAVRRASGSGRISQTGRVSQTGHALPEPIPEEASLQPEAPAKIEEEAPAPVTPEPPLRPVGQVVKLPPIGPSAQPISPQGQQQQQPQQPAAPVNRAPPARTPYGLATPFMMAGQAHHYAELQMLAHQVMEIRNISMHEHDDGDEDAPEVRELDQTLIKTLEMAHNAAAAEEKKKEGIDEAWLSDHLPKGNFGFGSKGPPGMSKFAPAVEPVTPVPEPPARIDALEPYDDDDFEEDDDAFLSLREIDVLAQSMNHRRSNLHQFCLDQLGSPLMEEVMAAVAEAQAACRVPGGEALTRAEHILRDRMLDLLGDDEEKLNEMLPLVEEMALLH